ncbi:monocarboxylate transporter [Irpex rosettiformis]|uniref:Monocarboxylate transporter n=1 Tax=Irpex rosettiformis TaxID=378272 RepID=A0ACB8U1F5_9APHY|nr:monocarboxylate transporter [Irpex rosettiformis]
MADSDSIKLHVLRRNAANHIDANVTNFVPSTSSTQKQEYPNTHSEILVEQRSASQLATLVGDEPPTTSESSDEEQWKPTRTYQALLLAAGFGMIFQVIGINSIYGVFQEFYTSDRSNITDAQGQDALVSFVGTLGTGLTWSGSIFVNPLIARTKHVQGIVLVGVFLMSLGIICASFSTKLWHLFLTQGILYGIGASLFYFPILSLTPMYFDRHRGFAVGLVLSGAGVGGLVLSPIIHSLITHLNIQWTLRILGLWNFAVGIPISFVVKRKPGRPIPSGTGSTRLNASVAKRGTFIWQALGAFLQAGGNVVPTYFLTTYSVSVLAYSSGTGSLLLAVNNIVNSVARVSMGILADRVGRQNTMIVSVILSGISVLALWYDAPRPRFIAFVVFYGILAGGYNALLPTTIAEVYGVQNYTSVNGFVYFIRGMGALFGAPLAGVILGHHQRGTAVMTINGEDGMGLRGLKKKYNEVAVYDGVLLLAAGACMAYVRWSDAKHKGGWSWRA